MGVVDHGLARARGYGEELRSDCWSWVVGANVEAIGLVCNGGHIWVASFVPCLLQLRLFGLELVE
jgi:hypothetical protein